MAGQFPRSKKPVIGESLGESEELDRPCGQTLDSGEVSEGAS
jgi:hypothetical protein